MQILRYASEHRINISAIYPFIAKSIAVGDRRVIESSSIIVDHILQKRTNVSSLRKDLARGLEKMHADYYGEQLLRLLVQIYLRTRDYLALMQLFQHPNQDVVLFANAALRDAIAGMGKSAPGYTKAVEILELKKED